MSQSRRWILTHHQSDIDVIKLFVSKLRSLPNFRGIAAQVEKCPTTGRLHLQGYLEMEKPVRMGALKKLSSTTHWEVAKGTREQCVAYCSKLESCVGGEDPAYRIIDDILKEGKTQGKRNDLLECAKLISSGDWTRKEVHEERPDLVLKFSKGVNELLRYREMSGGNDRRTELQVNVLWGEAGSGKTRYAYGTGEDVFILENSNGNSVWWDGYMGQPTLIIDDFYGWIPHNQLLRFLDIYPVRLDVKGGTTYAKWKTVYITSNRHPSEWYKKFVWEEDKALQRRIHHIWHAPKDRLWSCEMSGETRKVVFKEDI